MHTNPPLGMMLGSHLIFPREHPVREDILSVWEMCCSNGTISMYELKETVICLPVFLLI